MAPEQSEGNMLLQTDVYSFGVILYELLAGTVPFPLEHKSETSRNNVLVAHIERTPPDILPLRAEHMPTTWPEDRRNHEMQVPTWVIDMVRKCLQKDPQKRFADGIELYEYVLRNSTATVSETSELTAMLRDENKKLKEENSLLQDKLKLAATAPVAAAPILNVPPPVPQQTYYPEPPPPANNNRKWVLPAVLATIAAAAILFFVLKDNQSTQSNAGLPVDTSSMEGSTDILITDNDPSTPAPPPSGNDTVFVREQPRDTASAQPNAGQNPTDQPAADDDDDNDDPPARRGGRYLVASSRAYFHNHPNSDSRRDAYLTPSDEVMTALDEEGDYVYVVFKSSNGQTSRGWVLKRDLSPIE
jgi:serine/threonine-protein kinase